jgi:hypothetical protein
LGDIGSHKKRGPGPRDEKTSDVTIPWIINPAANKISFITLVTIALGVSRNLVFKHLRLNVYKKM